jgi:hypothetical protein
MPLIVHKNIGAPQVAVDDFLRMEVGKALCNFEQLEKNKSGPEGRAL